MPHPPRLWVECFDHVGLRGDGRGTHFAEEGSSAPLCSMLVDVAAAMLYVANEQRTDILGSPIKNSEVRPLPTSVAETPNLSGLVGERRGRKRGARSNTRLTDGASF
jgi:hypothetical protein